MYKNKFLKRIYSTWKGMMRRCYDINNPSYHIYGGKGVVVYNEWHDFQNFKNWYYRFDLEEKG